MTERCQIKFTENIENQNYIIYIGIISIVFAVLFIYRFHFIAVVLSYLLGCLACYYGINSNFLHKFIKKLKCHTSAFEPDKNPNNVPAKGCGACGSKECARHDLSISVEPWVGLQIHKQLDQAIEDFYNTILDQFVNSWYSKITLQPFFVEELRYQLRYASSCLLKQALKVDYPRFITERLVPCALSHYRACSREPPASPHPAAANRSAEMRYLTSVSEALMPLLLRPTETQNSVFRVLIREIFANWVLLSLTDVLADPYILNTLIILATGDETMAQLPPTPNYKVEFLERFGRRTESAYARRSALLAADLDLIIADQDHFYAFMQFLKAANHIQLLQFYKDIKLFQTKILNPELGQEEQAALHKEACEIYDIYLSQDSISRVPLEAALCDELHDLLQAPDCIKRLQTSRALYQAARESHDVLKKVMLPKFLHSEEYYKLIIGSRTPTGFHKQMSRKLEAYDRNQNFSTDCSIQEEKKYQSPDSSQFRDINADSPLPLITKQEIQDYFERNPDNLILSALKLGTRLKGALKTQTIDGQVLSDTNSEEGDNGDNIDVLKYLDALAAEEDLRDQDLSTYKVVLTDVETVLQAAPRRGTVRVFTVCAARAGGGPGAGALWAVRRSEHEFHLARAKLRELYGERLLHDLPLPSRRDNSPNETLRYKYEDFLQRLLQKSLVQTSKLLYLFLTVEGDFSAALQEASALNVNSNDIGNIYQAVALRLRKEKGQHLESFLTNLLVTSDMERYQALKQGNNREPDEEVELGEDAARPRAGRSGRAADKVFGDLFAAEPKVRGPDDVACGFAMAGFTQCLMFLLEKVVQARGIVTAVVGVLASVNRPAVDQAFNACLGRTLRTVLCERRLAHLIRLGHGLLFGKRSIPRCDRAKQQEVALRQLLGRVPSAGTLVLGAGLPQAVAAAFRLVQRPDLNKHLVYNLLDLCLLELFPELGDTCRPTNEPRS